MTVQFSRRPTDTTKSPCPPYRISLVIPALNEERGLRRILPAVPHWIDELIVVDGGSTDATVQVVRELTPAAEVIYQRSRGKGGALKEGIAASGGDIIITMDADGSMDPGDALGAIHLLLGGVDFVKGSRCLPDGGSSDFTRLRAFGNWALTRLANGLYDGNWSDITYGFNVYWRGILVELDGLSNGFDFEIQLAVRAARSGLAIAEVPVYEAPRVAGVSKLSPLGDGWKILKLLMREARPTVGTKIRPCADLYLQPRHPAQAAETRGGERVDIRQGALTAVSA